MLNQLRWASVSALAVTLGVVSTAAAEEQISKTRGELSLEVPFTLSQFSSLPSGFKSRDVAPPLTLGMKLGAAPVGSKMGVELGAYLATQTQGPNAMLGLSVAPQWLIAGHGILSVGLEFDSQDWLKTSPLKNSQFDQSRFGIGARYAHPIGAWTPALTVKAVSPEESNFAAVEGFATQIRWDDSYLVRPEARWDRDPSAGLIDSVEGSLGVHLVGAAAIASKEFAYYIPSRTAFRPVVGVGSQIFGFELWLKAAAVMISKPSDPVSYLYQATSFRNDYLLAPLSMAVEARWIF